MCGIVGFVDQELSPQVLEAMMDQVAHRGPDGSGMYIDDDIALGHRRLAIIDLNGGCQPMKSAEGTFVCIFNGEIYNYRELRAQLEEIGHHFTTKSDTEVLIHGYEEWKEDLPVKLRGMFAFAIWDKARRELFCARDYFGIKPFYYYQSGDVLMFGSEIKSFLVHPQFEKKLNMRQLELYLTYQYSPGNETFFEHVYKLPPAHSMLWKDSTLTIKRYWQPTLENQTDESLEDLVSELDSCIQDSVNVHKISDVEVGSFLSSGVDSSYIASLSHVNKTFSIGFDNKRYDEGSDAHEFSRTIGVENDVYRICPEEFWESLPKIQYYLDEPLADASCVALFFLNREASKQVKVCLSGEGADELFAGYNIYKEPFMWGWYDHIPGILRSAIGDVAQCLPAVRGVNFLTRHSKVLSERYIGNTVIFNEVQKKKVLKGYLCKNDSISLAQPFFKAPAKADDVTRMQFTDLNLWLIGDILLKADKMSMANSLELRVPFLDKEVFEVARRIPTKYKVNKEETKIALRRAATCHIGTTYAARKKRGFPVPIRDWLRDEQYVEKVRSCFDSEPAKMFFHTKELHKLLDEHLSGKQDHWRQIWCVYMFLIWYDVYFGRDFSTSRSQTQQRFSGCFYLSDRKTPGATVLPKGSDAPACAVPL